MNNQIKMFIAGEEVVSDREFTINEEMLSASSTILNNCYPKSWELNKDYISNFYYPKDYSQFILGQGNFLHGNDEYGAVRVQNYAGSINYTTNVEKEWNSFQRPGDTIQQTEPIGKNMLLIGNVSNTLGLTITRRANSEIRISGMSSGAGTINIPLGANYTLTNRPYTFSITSTGTISKNIFISLYQSASLNNLSMSSASTTSLTSINENGRVINAIQIVVQSATRFTNFDMKFQLEQNTSATSFEQYSFPMPSPEYPSELVSVGYENLFGSNLKQGCRLFANGNYANVANYVCNENPISVEEEKTYIISAKNYIPKSEAGFVFFNNGTFVSSLKTSSLTFTVPKGANQVYYDFYTSTNITPSDITLPQLTKGTQAHSYIPYGKYGIEVKNTGKNLIPKATKINGIVRDVFGNNGITFTNKGGGFYHIKGTATAQAEIYTFRPANEGESIIVPVGTYTFSSPSLPSGVKVITSGGGGNNGFSYAELTSTNLSVTSNVTNGEKPFNFIVIRVASGTIVDNDICFQLEKGNTATTYEAYKENTQLYQLDEPLRKIGILSDLLYTNNNNLYVKRNIGRVVLNGSESGWASFKDNSNHYNYYIHRDDISKTVWLCLSNYFKYRTSGNNSIGEFQIGGYNPNKNGNIIFNPFSDTTNRLNNFKTWLSSNNVEVLYPLQTSQIENLGEIEMPTSYNGVNNVFTYDGINDNALTVYYYWKNYDVLFSGIVKNSGDVSLNPRYPHYCSLQILDYKTFLSESDTLDFVISNKTIAEAISMVIDAVSGYGFIVGNIDISSANDVIGAYSTLNKTAYDVFQYLANISGSRWRARYVDSDTMAIDFYDPDTLPQASDIEYTKEYWENNNIVDLTFNFGTRDYRNKQVMLSNEVYASINYTEVLLSNGYDTNFIVQNNIGNVIQITVNDVNASFTTQEEKDLGLDADFYFTPGKNVIESTSSYTAGSQVAITYTPLVKGRQIVYNDEEVTRIATQTNTLGVISRYENRNDILSSNELEQIGESYIEYKGKAEVILTLKTQNNDLYNIGEVVYFNAPIPELAQNYMVKTKKTEYVVINEVINLFYIYELTSSFNSEKAINYFDNQRNKSQGNIQLGESITRNIDINNLATIIWDNATITEVSITTTGDNTLNSVLNSPFIE